MNFFMDAVFGNICVGIIGKIKNQIEKRTPEQLKQGRTFTMGLPATEINGVETQIQITLTTDKRVFLDTNQLSEHLFEAVRKVTKEDADFETIGDTVRSKVAQQDAPQS